MPQSCKILKCPRVSSALCNCCEKQLCNIHMDEHYQVLVSQLQPIINDMDTLDNDLKVFDRHKTIAESLEKLEQWRLESYQIINHLFEEKCEELKRCIEKKISKQTEKIEQARARLTQIEKNHEVTRQEINFLSTIVSQMKKDITNIDNTFIQVKTLPLKISRDILPITESIRPKIDQLTLAPPCKTINHSDKSSSVLASNTQFLLVHQERNLCVINHEMNVVKEVSWPYSNIHDMCWSTTLDRFILINENDVFLVDENLALIDKLPTFSNKKWLCCTCSETSLFLSTNELGSSINEFSLLPRIGFIKQWSSPFTCKDNEVIDNMVYTNGKLGLMIKNLPEKSIRIELRFSGTLDYIWSLPLNIKCTKKMAFRCCLLSFDELLVADHDTCQLLHITKSGQIKTTIKYKVVPNHVNLFNHNILVVFSKNVKNFHQLV